MQVREIMSRQFRIVPPQTTLQQAAQMMREGDFGFLPVGEADHLQGTLTDRDIVIRAVADGKSSDTPVEDVLTEDVICCREEDDVDDAARLMRRKQIRRLAVVDDMQRMVGVLSVGDIAREGDNEDLTGEIETDVAQPS